VQSTKAAMGTLPTRRRKKTATMKMTAKWFENEKKNDNERKKI